MEGQEIIKKNLPIVTTPYSPEKLDKMIIRRNKLKKMNFITIFEDYNFMSFLKTEKLSKWKEYFLNE